MAYKRDDKQEKDSAQAAPGYSVEKPSFAAPTTPTKGERMYHLLTYTGVGYFANLAVSLVVADFFLAGGGKPFLNRIIAAKTAFLQANTRMSPETAYNISKTAAQTAVLPLGGHLIMAPLKYLEDHARYYTHVLNQKYNPDYAYKDLKATINTPEDQLPGLVDEPHDQTWGQIAMRRGIAWGAVTAVGTLSGEARNTAIQNWTLDKFDRAMSVTGSKSLQSMRQNPTFERYARLAALDSYFTVLTSAIVYGTNTLFGEKRKGKHDQEQADPQPKSYADQVKQEKQQAASLDKKQPYENYREKIRLETASPEAYPTL